MNFIKIGERYINLDRVTAIHPVHDGGLDIYFGHPQDEPRNRETVRGQEAEALKRWLEESSYNVMGERPRGVGLIRSE